MSNNIDEEINTDINSEENVNENNNYIKRNWSDNFEEYEKNDENEKEENNNVEDENKENIDIENKEENYINYKEKVFEEEKKNEENIKKINEKHEIKKVDENKNYLKIVLMPKIKDEYIKIEEEYDENIIFFHTKRIYERLDFFNNLVSYENYNLPYLSDTIFLFEKNSTITEDKAMITQTNLSKEELIEIIKKRISGFNKEIKVPNKRYVEYFIRNLPVYVKILDDEDIKNLFQDLNENINSLETKFILILLEKLEEIVKYFNIEKKIEILKDDVTNLIFTHLFKSSFLENSIIKDKLYNLVIYLCINTHEDTISLNILNNIVKNTNSDSLISTIRGENFMLVGKLIILLLKSEMNNKEEFCIKFILPLIKVLYIDKNPKIRVSVGIILPELSNYININTHINELRTLFSLLSVDENPEVRLQSVKILPKIMKDNLEKSNFSEENTFYIDIYSKLIFDNDKKVRHSAFQILGDVIYLFNMDDVDKKAKKLIDFFKNNIDQFYFYKDISYSNVNEDIIYYATLILPTLIYRLGEKNFDSGFNLKEVLIKLCNYNKEIVQRSLLFKFKEIYQLLSKDSNRKEMIELYQKKFIYSKFESIQTQAILEFKNILKISGQETRKKFIKFIGSYLYIDVESRDEIPYDSENKLIFTSYRQKIECLNNLTDFFDAYDDETIIRKIIPVIILFCCDNVDLVRKESANTLGTIILYLNEKKVALSEIQIILKAFCFSETYKLRNQFINLCYIVLKSKKIFEIFIFDLLLNLAQDKIIDVIIKFRILILDIINMKDCDLNYLLKEEKFQILIELVNQNENNKYEKIKHGEISNEEIEKYKNEKKYIEPDNSDMRSLKELFNIDLYV